MHTFWWMVLLYLTYNCFNTWYLYKADAEKDKFNLIFVLNLIFFAPIIMWYAATKLN